MSTNRWDPKAKKPPKGFAYLTPVLSFLKNELHDKVCKSNARKCNTKLMWPVHQINWQQSRYVYDMYYLHHRITKKVYKYCVRNKLINTALIAKWKKTGYEQLCLMYVINFNNYKFGTSSICHVPLKDHLPEQLLAMDLTTGCWGCASKAGQPRNIFGNKYGQNLTAVQIARDIRTEELEQKERSGVGEGRGGACIDNDVGGGGEERRGKGEEGGIAKRRKRVRTTTTMTIMVLLPPRAWGRGGASLNRTARGSRMAKARMVASAERKTTRMTRMLLSISQRN
jgi:bud site selection protein 31